MQRTVSDYLLVVLKGMGMGAADIIPGVSGGTIAFITGIYQELINSIKSVNLEGLRILKKEGAGKAWKHINGNFLVAVFGGILFSIFPWPGYSAGCWQIIRCWFGHFSSD